MSNWVPIPALRAGWSSFDNPHQINQGWPCLEEPGVGGQVPRPVELRWSHTRIITHHCRRFDCLFVTEALFVERFGGLEDDVFPNTRNCGLAHQLLVIIFFYPV